MKRIKRLCLLLAMLIVLGGCSGLSAEELYRLPEASEDYYDLQAALNDVLAEGYNYLAPSSGARQEPIQLTDLDGDGVDEAVAFFRSSTDGAVEIYIFSKESDVYVPSAVIDGAGSSVVAVEYTDLDGRGDLELVLTYQVSEMVTQALQVYRYDENGAVNMLTASCSRYDLADLDGDGLEELFCLTSNGAETSATVEYYDGVSNELRRSGELRLSFSYDNLRRVKQGTLADGAEGMLVSGVTGDGTLITDVFATSEEGLCQVVPDEDILRSGQVDGSYAYPTDIDGDGVMEIARTEPLPGAVTDSVYRWAIRWYGLAGDGEYEDKMVTYQNFDENWYFQFPEYWDGVVAVKDEDVSTAINTVSFYRILQQDDAGGVLLDLTDEDEAERILTIYSLRGANRQSYAEETGLTILYKDSDIIYAVDLNEDARAWEGSISMAQVSEMFHLLHSGMDGENAAGTN